MRNRSSLVPPLTKCSNFTNTEVDETIEVTRTKSEIGVHNMKKMKKKKKKKKKKKYIVYYCALLLTKASPRHFANALALACVPQDDGSRIGGRRMGH